MIAEGERRIRSIFICIKNLNLGCGVLYKLLYMIAVEKEINNYFITTPNLEKALDRENVYATNIIDPFKKKPNIIDPLVT